MKHHSDAEGAENHVRLPLNIPECWGDEERQSQVEIATDVSIIDPRVDCRHLIVATYEANTLGAILQGEDLSAVNPCSWSPFNS